MKITTLLGSPHKKGNTSTILKCFEERAAHNHDIERIHITDYSVQGCVGCSACQRVRDRPGCLLKDDGAMILEKLTRSDLIVYASPVYVWGFTAQLKALLDRQCSLVKYGDTGTVHLLKGKRTALLVTCAGSEEKNVDLIREIFTREMEYLQCSVAGIYAVAGCTKPQDLGDRGIRIAEKMIGRIFQ
jgi:multimeric flavodoxin WrbA